MGDSRRRNLTHSYPIKNGIWGNHEQKGAKKPLPMELFDIGGMGPGLDYFPFAKNLRTHLVPTPLSPAGCAVQDLFGRVPAGGGLLDFGSGAELSDGLRGQGGAGAERLEGGLELSEEKGGVWEGFGRCVCVCGEKGGLGRFGGEVGGRGEGGVLKISSFSTGLGFGS